MPTKVLGNRNNVTLSAISLAARSKGFGKAVLCVKTEGKKQTVKLRSGFDLRAFFDRKVAAERKHERELGASLERELVLKERGQLYGEACLKLFNIGSEKVTGGDIRQLDRLSVAAGRPVDVLLMMLIVSDGFTEVEKRRLGECPLGERESLEKLLKLAENMNCHAAAKACGFAIAALDADSEYKKTFGAVGFQEAGSVYSFFAGALGLGRSIEVAIGEFNKLISIPQNDQIDDIPIDDDIRIDGLREACLAKLKKKEFTVDLQRTYRSNTNNSLVEKADELIEKTVDTFYGTAGADELNSAMGQIFGYDQLEKACKEIEHLSKSPEDKRKLAVDYVKDQVQKCAANGHDQFCRRVPLEYAGVFRIFESACEPYLDRLAQELDVEKMDADQVPDEFCRMLDLCHRAIDDSGQNREALHKIFDHQLLMLWLVGPRVGPERTDQCKELTDSTKVQKSRHERFSEFMKAVRDRGRILNPVETVVKPPLSSRKEPVVHSDDLIYWDNVPLN